MHTTEWLSKYTKKLTKENFSKYFYNVIRSETIKNVTSLDPDENQTEETIW